MKKFLGIILWLQLIMIFSLDAQPVLIEKLAELPNIKSSYDFMWGGPHIIIVDEAESTMVVPDKNSRAYVLHFDSGKINNIEEAQFEDQKFNDVFIPLLSWRIGFTNGALSIRKDQKEIFYYSMNGSNGGISFILKKEPGYIVYFVDPDGAVKAVDTTGKVYISKDALEYLKAYDLIKFEQSQKRAQELGLLEKFNQGKALVWDKTYYSTPRLLKEYWQKVVYPNTALQIQYDSQGNGYMAALDTPHSEIWIVDPNARYLAQIDVTNYSKILSTYEMGHIFTHSTYVGFGGNIYFYVAGDDYTEVFRIRRNWGNPDMYALAINGYTKDPYGEYVDKVLEKMSKDDLRLLRNHIFALYGYDFKDAGLKTYFDKQVWYLAKPDVDIAALNLPQERRSLVERIQEEEKKR